MAKRGTHLTDEERELCAAHDRYTDYLAAGGMRSQGTWRTIRSNINAAVAFVEAVKDAPPPLPERGSLPIDRFYEAVKSVTAAQIERQDRPAVVEWTAPEDAYTAIVFIGDIHVGGLIDYDRLERDLDVVRTTPGLYAVGMGDYADHFQDAGKLQHAMAGNTVPDSEDQDELVQHIMGLAGDKWLALLAGNHDEWGGPGSVVRLARHVGAHYVSQAGCSIKIRLGGQKYIGYCKHQWRGHSVISTSNESRRFWLEWNDFENADFTVLAHYHQPDTHQVERKGSTVGHLRGGTYKQIDTHSARLGFTPGYGPSLIILNPYNHEVIPFHGPNWLRGIQFLRWLREKPRDESDLLVFSDGQ